MELRQLRHFLILAEEMHFGRAAERLRLSQPALSASIVKLEDLFRVRLFERDSKSVRLTPAGTLMVARAEEVLNQAHRAESFSAALAAGRVGRLEIGFSGLLPYQGFDRVLAHCRKAYPEIDICLREFTSPRQVELIRAGGLDAGLVSAEGPPAGLGHIRILESRYVVCLPQGHGLAGRDRIDITELRDQDFVMLSKDKAPRVHEIVTGFCALAGFHPRVAFETAHTLSTLALVARGLGVALVVESLAGVRMEGAVFVPLARPLPGRTGYFVWNSGREMPGLQVLVDTVRHVFAVPHLQDAPQPSGHA